MDLSPIEIQGDLRSFVWNTMDCEYAMEIVKVDWFRIYDLEKNDTSDEDANIKSSLNDGEDEERTHLMATENILEWRWENEP